MKVLHKWRQDTDTVRGWERGGQEGLGDAPSVKWKKLDWLLQVHLTPKSRLYVQHHIASISDKHPIWSSQATSYTYYDPLTGLCPQGQGYIRILKMQ